jgi:hypothetical protein
MKPYFLPISCENCGHSVVWPRWRKLAAREYHPLCGRCFAQSYLIITMARQVTR